MKIKALKEYTDQYISIYEEDVREVTDEVLAAKLIEDGVLQEKTEEEEEEETPSEDPTPDPDSAPVG